ncbi:MAG: MerR family transcriptional regulator [Acidobacteriia bacterium]|nr:MerR family transcriptional regulator [Terriglobia bacterium]
MASAGSTNNLIKIGALARNAHVSLRTLRYYEEIGLIAPASHSKGGHRLYSGEDVKKLEVINYLKSLPLSLEEIKEIFTVKKSTPTREKKEQVAVLIKLLESKLGAVNGRIQELSGVKDELSGMVDILRECARCEGKPLLEIESCGDCKAVDRRGHAPLMMSVFLERGA